MTELLTAAAVLLAWFVFRYERDGRVRDAIESAYATLRAVQHAMVQGRASGQQGWGQAYFEYDYPEDKAYERADKSRDLVLGHNFEQIFVVPTEPLAKLATASPREGLIEYDTVASASFALWNVQKFNQNVRQLTEFYTQHLVEISSEATTQERLEGLANGARSLSFMLHRHSIGWAWSVYPNGQGRGWYGDFVETLDRNMRDLDDRRSLRVWQRFLKLPYVAVDALVLVLVIASVIHVAWPDSHPHPQPQPRGVLGTR
jgi:hypothetical protein